MLRCLKIGLGDRVAVNIWANSDNSMIAGALHNDKSWAEQHFMRRCLLQQPLLPRLPLRSSFINN